MIYCRDQRSNQAHLDLQSYTTQTELFRYKILFQPHSKRIPENLEEKCELQLIIGLKHLKHLILAEDGFDPSTSGLRAQHASAAPLCCMMTNVASNR